MLLTDSRNGESAHQARCLASLYLNPLFAKRQGAGAVGDQQNGGVAQVFGDGRADQGVGFHVHAGRGLVHEHDARLRQQGSR